MSMVERLFLGAFALIALYVLFNATQAASVISGIGENVSGIFGTLQGGNVKFPNVQVSRPGQFGF
jgi:hypothetical protein